MKNVLTILVLLSVVSNARAQTTGTVSTEILADTRISFNRKLVRKESYDIRQLPCSAYLFRQPGECGVEIEGLTFITRNNSIAGIKGFDLPEEALMEINARLELLDKLQWAYSEASNSEYRSGQKDIHAVVFNDRRFFAILKAIRTTARAIKKIYLSDLTVGEKSDALVRMRPANVDMQFYRQLTETENQKMIAGKIRQ
ncbi:hypothetical protein [Pedobacter sp. UBA5917]|jgi:hypothetical protein|uniref:hypothetical protein n=1 Tax=Pedobacter sp. UBA5917 TaxID=1947061 RepID=UPI0025F1C127|nr:hypothetical protein [Pedobacter sp. UBA5917]